MKTLLCVPLLLCFAGVPLAGKTQEANPPLENVVVQKNDAQGQNCTKRVTDKPQGIAGDANEKLQFYMNGPDVADVNKRQGQMPIPDPGHCNPYPKKIPWPTDLPK